MRIEGNAVLKEWSSYEVNLDRIITKLPVFHPYTLQIRSYQNTSVPRNSLNFI